MKEQLEENNKTFNIFKIKYDWHEGEYRETFLGKNVKQEEFEKDLIQAKEFAESLKGKGIKKGDYLGKGYTIECLPEYYGQIIWFLTNKLEYTKCYIDEETTYDVNDYPNRKISLTRFEERIEHYELKNSLNLGQKGLKEENS